MLALPLQLSSSTYTIISKDVLITFALILMLSASTSWSSGTVKMLQIVHLLPYLHVFNNSCDCPCRDITVADLPHNLSGGGESLRL